ncbi:GrpB family protein [Paenibacillus sp. 5J-6]|uniref:GrpB family protein n=1 Tax=Paenibacillus silvestris TaxID=2606219 RepID=A0A6L8UTK3_9BACL|nr:GrpB family protein [Paenibacillus silvestris]MZQ81234.1 GrpB family protein [Paenibacillus silvestris]
MEKPVVIEHYNENWPFEYIQEERKIKEIFHQKAIAIEHIGSTSVQGLGAKPVIDFMVGVNELTEVEEFIEPLAQIGFEHVYHKEFPNRRFFRKGPRKAGTHHLHVYNYGSEEWKNQLLFRDYLRTHPDVLKQYNDLKQILAEQYRNDRTAYTNAKNPFITDVIQIAKSSISDTK